MTQEVPKDFSLAWVDAAWKDYGDYIMLREEDNVLIMPPNRVYHVNPTGARIIRWLQSGKKIEDFPGLNDERRLQVDRFFQNITLAMSNKEHHAARIPYTFDYTKLPILGEIATTYRCNNRCRFCYAGCDGAAGRLDAPDIEPEKLERIIDIFKSEAKIPFFSFTGGEPLMRKDLERLMRYACDKGLRINLVTNGTLATPERAKSLYEAGLRTAQISLESPDEDIHDKLCGRKGSWQQTIDGINNLRDAGIAVQTNTTSTRMNIHTLTRLPALCKSLGCVRMSVNLFIPTKRSPQSDELFISYEEIAPFVDEIRKAAFQAEIDFLWYSPLPMCIYNTLAKGLGNKNCAACDGLISVDPDGNVLPCSSWDEPVGNLLTEGFQNVWFNKRAKAIKNKCFAHESCKGCSAFTACQCACPLYWQYAGYDELLRHSWNKPVTDNTEDPS
ncbi:MAG: radical SAM protein [Proteobacteria bacterium]|jgi:radical SAM protein with 4Fe4S-binding SPASM domain|nr:radical SAM protein [Pseudomonadota bacterium]